MHDDLILGTIDSELAFLGACMTDTAVLADATVTGNDFENPAYGKLFDSMCERYVRHEGVSQALMSEMFPEHTRIIWEATNFLNELPLAANHEQVIRDKATRRLLKQAAIRINSIASGNEMADIVDRCRAEVDAALRGDTSKVVSMQSDVVAVLAEHRKQISLVPTPWRKLNETIGGFGPGRMYVVGARPGVGKSALASQMAYELAATGPVIFATMEMDKGEVYSRILAQQAQVYYGAINAPKSDFMAAREQQWLATQVRDIRVLDNGTQTVGGIRTAVRSASRDGKVAGVIVDYIHLLTSKEGENETTRLAAITRGLKQMAMDFKVPVVALSQLNRAVTSRMDARPGLGDLRGSGAIEQDGDVVIFLYRDSDEEETALSKRLNVYVGKNRQGPSFVGFDLEWQGDFVRAVDWE